MQGIVFSAESQAGGGRSALTAHERELYYKRERDVYLRLQEHEISSVRGCNVPELLRYNDALWIVEMTVVRRPFVLDFAGAFLDEPPEFSEDVIAEWRTEKEEQFGARWPDVQAILGELEGCGIFLVDVNPGNVSFGP